MAATFSELNGGTPFSLTTPNNKWSLEVALAVQQNVMALCFRPVPLGGSLLFGLDGNGALDAYDAIPLTIPGADVQGFTFQVRVRCRTDSAGTSVTPKLRNITNSADLVVGSAVTSTTDADQTMTFSMPSATKEVRLMFTKSNPKALVYGVGVLEILAP